MDAIKALFIDIGGVLLTNGWDHASRKLAADTFNLDQDDMQERHHLTFDTYESGKLSLDEYLNRVVFYEPRPFSMDDFRAFMFQQSQPYSNMIDLVCRVKELNALKVAVVSNEGRELTEYRIETYRLNDFVDFFISSCFVHIRKPDVDIFRMALDIAQIPARQVIYIEDRPMFARVAEDLGIRSIVHKDYRATGEQLAQWGLKVES